MSTTNDLIAIKQLFDLCIDVTPAQRQTLLAQSDCSAAQIDEVQRLLALADDETQQLQQSAIINSQIQDLGQKLDRGQQLDAYQIDDEIGRGGMGIVFLAHRADGSYQQKVAIKIIPSFASSEELQRFHRERQILAQLQHPNIAMLLDGGSTSDNRPYLVMEYVKGSPITDFAQQQNLDLKQRLQLFCSVCEAVAFAHSNLVIHRDLKPENVLVTDDGKVKLLDFGVSKILQSEQLSGMTTIQQGLTLCYASPEQIKGQSTTTATDVYGLGVLLYQLLCDNLPHPLKADNNEAIFSAICLDDPVRPSMVAKQNNLGVLHKAIKGDLDNIVNKSLRKEPIERYAGVNELHQDIQRYLSEKAVLASPPDLGYRFNKFVRRHPLSVALSAALVLALSGGLLSSINLTRQLTTEKQTLLQTQDKLQQEVDTSEQVIQLLTGMFKAASPANAKGGDISVPNLVNTAVDQTQNALEQQPIVKSRLLATLATVQRRIGQENKALLLLEESIAIKQAQGIPLTIHDLTQLALFNRLAGKHKQTLKFLNEAQQLTQHQQTPEDMAALEHGWFSYHYDMSQFDKALEYSKKRQKYAQTLPQNNFFALDIQEDHARVYFALNQYDKALPIFESILEARTKHLGADHVGNISTLSNLADIYRRLSRNDIARKTHQRAYQMASDYYDPNFTNVFNIVTTYAVFLADMGELLEAKAMYDQQITPALTNKRSLGLYLAFRAAIDMTLGNYQTAQADLVRSNNIMTELYGDSLSMTYNTRHKLGLAQGLIGNLSQGQKMLEDLYQQGSKIWGADALPLSTVKLSQGLLAIKSDDYDKAKQLIDFTQNVYDTKKIGKDHMAYKDNNDAYALLYKTQSRWSESLTYIDKNLQLLGLHYQRDSLEKRLLQLNKAEALWHLDDKAQAQQLLQANREAAMQYLTSDSVHYRYIHGLQALIGG